MNEEPTSSRRFDGSERILFVCVGNTCRSPMAAALAADIFPNATVESAGWSPGESIAQNATLVVGETTGTDIAGYKPRDVAGVDLATFDRVVVLDPGVAEKLAATVRPDALVTWDVQDPSGGSVDDYRECASALRGYIESLADKDV
jgi:protein-tyrosine-phosphatase